jgi:hypothetical protein
MMPVAGPLLLSLFNGAGNGHLDRLPEAVVLVSFDGLVV